MDDYEERLLRACLAALVRRINSRMAIPYWEVNRELDRETQVDCVLDADAVRLRIAVREVPA
jgi:hypothetical protein